MVPYRLKVLTVGVVATLICSSTGNVPASERDVPPLLSRTDPLRVDPENKRVLIYTEVNPKSHHQNNPHWGVVFRGGKLHDKGLLLAFCTPESFYDALTQIGARPGNNLTLRSSGEFIAGDEVVVSVIVPGTSQPLGLAEIFDDTSGKGFHIRFGGNRQRAVEEQTGCITCLESCPVGITSNASYPAISSFKRMLSPNCRFKGRAEKLPPSGKMVLIYSR